MSESIIVVEKDCRLLSAIELMDKGASLRVIRSFCAELPADELNPQWIENLWRMERFAHRKVVCSLPPGMVKYRSVVLPELPENQLPAAVEMELGAGENDDIHRVVHHRLEGGKYQVGVAVIKQDDLQSYLQFWKDAGLEVRWSDLRAAGIENYISRCCDESHKEDGLVYLDARSDKVEFGFFKGGRLGYHRVFAFAPEGAGEEEAGDSLTELLHELHLSLAAVADITGGRLNENIYFFGHDNAASLLAEPIRDRFGLRLIPPESSRLLGLVDQGEIQRIAPLAGLALTRPEREPRRQRIYSLEQIGAAVKRRKTLRVLEICGGLLILLAGGGLIFQAKQIREDKSRQWLADQAAVLAELQRTAQSADEGLTRIKVYESWMSQRGRELEFMRLLDQYLPEQTRITDLTIENGVIKDLAGCTPSVSSLLDHFRTIPVLRDLKLKGAVVVDPTGEQFHLEGPITLINSDTGEVAGG